MSLTLFPLFLALCTAYQGMLEGEEPQHYQLLCADGSAAANKGLHACCGQECALCARMPGLPYEQCAFHCNGTVVMVEDEEPRCIECVCRKLEPIKYDDDVGTRFHGCPYMQKKRKQEL